VWTPLLAVVAAGCEGPQSALDTAGRDAQQIASLFWIMFAGALLVWLSVVVIAIYSIRARREAHGSRAASLLVIGGGVLLPAVTLAALLAHGMPVLGDILTPAPEGSLRLDVTAKQWWWRVRYLANGTAIETANEIRLPVGQRVNLQLVSDDVIHSFWVPSIAGKVDMFPGRVTRLPLEPTRIGTFRGACAEYCGTSHALMRLIVVVMTPSDFQRWLDHQAAPATDAGSGEIEFLANGCSACHTIRGTEASGLIGPDLTHVGSRLEIGAGTLANDPQALVTWIAQTDRMKPDVHMPAFRALPADRLAALATYLTSLK
jgi:cytochrome c oxidase subunit 2